MSELARYKQSGKYHKIIKGNTSYYTFIPNPLTEGLEIEVDVEMATLMLIANRLLGQLEGMSAFLPNVEAIESVFVSKEAHQSCSIDGINESLYCLLNASEKNHSKTRVTRDYITAMKYGFGKLAESKYQNKILCEIHKELVTQDKDASSGSFRTEQVFIGKMVIITNSQHYIPSAPSDILASMRDLEKFIQRKDSIDAIIKTALAHYQIETIHPFKTGNGRVGRILAYLVLLNMRVLTRPIICISQYFLLNRAEYIDRMERLRQVQVYEQWIKFFIEAVIYAADDSIRRINAWMCIREESLKKIECSGKTVKTLRKAFNIIELCPIINVNTLSERAEVSYNTAASMLKQLMDLEIIRVTNGKERYRDYMYTDFWNCFLGDTE
jgi:Fic family protein